MNAPANRAPPEPTRTPARPPDAAPELTFTVEQADTLPFAAVPTLRFALRLACPGGVAVRSVMLAAQLRIAAARRTYDASTRARLVELFGTASQWATATQSLCWTQATLLVPAFTGSTRVELLVPCTYDFDVTTAKYFHAVREGDVPLDFLFSGTLFYDDPDGRLRTARIAWDREARYRLPIAVWQATMDRHFPDTSWLRLHRDAFDRLYAYRTARGLLTWEDALDALLREAGAAPTAGARPPAHTAS